MPAPLSTLAQVALVQIIPNETQHATHIIGTTTPPKNRASYDVLSNDPSYNTTDNIINTTNTINSAVNTTARTMLDIITPGSYRLNTSLDYSSLIQDTVTSKREGIALDANNNPTNPRIGNDPTSVIGIYALATLGMLLMAAMVYLALKAAILYRQDRQEQRYNHDINHSDHNHNYEPQCSTKQPISSKQENKALMLVLQEKYGDEEFTQEEVDKIIRAQPDYSEQSVLEKTNTLQEDYTSTSEEELSIATLIRTKVKHQEMEMDANAVPLSRRQCKSYNQSKVKNPKI